MVPYGDCSIGWTIDIVPYGDCTIEWTIDIVPYNDYSVEWTIDIVPYGDFSKPWWWLVAENIKNLGPHTILLQAVLNESGASMFAGKELPCSAVRFTVIGE